MQRITADLRRLTLSGAAACAVLTAAYHEAGQHRDPLAGARTRISPPIMVKAISLAVPPLWRTLRERISVSGVEEDAKALPTLRRSRELALKSQSALALR
jgi:hypothetical protein